MSKSLYKGKYFLAFYDMDDETLLHIFDNVHEILRFIKRPITYQNVNEMNVQLYRAFKRNEHCTSILGYKTRVYMINAD